MVLKFWLWLEFIFVWFLLVILLICISLVYAARDLKKPGGVSQQKKALHKSLDGVDTPTAENTPNFHDPSYSTPETPTPSERL